MFFKGLAPHFRNVVFNIFSYGGNTIPEKLDSKYETPEDIFRISKEWIDGAFKALDPLLPEKFYLTSHCAGAYLAAIWALSNPHRVEKLFLNEPAGIIKVPPNFDPYNERLSDENIKTTS